MRKYILVTLILGLFTIVGSSVSFATVSQINLVDDATGGGCAGVGTWDNTNKICTLTGNVTDSHFVIDDSNITLDCAGFMMTGQQTFGDRSHSQPAITLGTGPTPTHVTVQNCHIKNFCGGVIFEDSTNNNILNNIFEDIFQHNSIDCEDGVRIDDDYDVIAGNEFIQGVVVAAISLNFATKSGKDTYVYNNKILGVDASDLIDLDCRAGGDADGTVIEQNLMQDERETNDGIETSNNGTTCNNVSILRNRILNVDSDCIETEGTNFKVNHNLCQFSDDEAFEVGTQDSEYKHNVLVHSNERDANGTCDSGDEFINGTMEIENGAHGNEFSYNIIRTDGCGNGILIESDSDDNVIKHNRIYGNFFNGIFVEDTDAEGTEIKYNKIYNNGLNGVKNAGTNTEIDDNMIRNNTEYGIVDCTIGSISSQTGNKGKGGFEGFLDTNQDFCLCGNNEINGGETCDGFALDAQTCTTVPGGFSGGILACDSDCQGFDTSGCTGGP